MAKRLMAKVGEYQKDGQTKGEYVKIGVIMSNQNGEYALIEPTVSIAGVLAKQNAMALASGGKVNSNVMCSIFDDNNQQRHQGNQRTSNGYQNGQQGVQSKPQSEPSFDNDLDDLPF